jgi:hypothetical protein
MKVYRKISKLKYRNRIPEPVSYGILNPMVNWTRGRFTYDILTPGSIFLMVFWPRGQFFVIVFW